MTPVPAAQPASAPQTAVSLSQALAQAAGLRDRAQWADAIAQYARIERALPGAAEIKHNLGLCHFGRGHSQQARQYCEIALQLQSGLWQSRILLARIHQAAAAPELAEAQYLQVLEDWPDNGEARLGLADLTLNEFGDPLAAIALVEPLRTSAQHGQDAELTTLMASLYDRDQDAVTLTRQIMAFSRQRLALARVQSAQPQRSSRPRLRVGLLSPQFCASPVFFLTIAFFRRIAAACDLVIFNRGTRSDWATEAFRALGGTWREVVHLGATDLSEFIRAEELDELYDLGGWMDPVGLQALSLKPAPRQYKWVGGQSVTTGLDCFDGWIGDQWQSPWRLQALYSEPLINLGEDYAAYTPPPYLPQPARHKREVMAVFANPAKLSRAFLAELAAIPGHKCFIHRQYRHRRVRDRIEAALDSAQVDYLCPESHKQALEAVNQCGTMIDTFPYSSGLTAREALAMGTRVRVLRVGQLFCERHTARYQR